MTHLRRDNMAKVAAICSINFLFMLFVISFCMICPNTTNNASDKLKVELLDKTSLAESSIGDDRKGLDEGRSNISSYISAFTDWLSGIFNGPKSDIKSTVTHLTKKKQKGKTVAMAVPKP